MEAPPSEDGTTSKIEYRVWNPFRSKLAAAILGGVDGIHIVPGAKVRMTLGVLRVSFVQPNYLYTFCSYTLVVDEVANCQVHDQIDARDIPHAQGMPLVSLALVAARSQLVCHGRAESSHVSVAEEKPLWMKTNCSSPITHIATGALPWCSCRYDRVACCGHRRTCGVCVRRGVCSPARARPHQHGQVAHQRDPHH